MITLGLTGWSDHDTITTHSSRRLEDYSSHFPVVEMDTSFYAIPSQANIQSWISKTPTDFQFFPKAYQAMTTHKKWFEDDYESRQALFDHFRKNFEPMYKSGKVKAFLFQFPPFFDLKKDHVRYLKLVRKMMEDWPVAIEFRHPSWFKKEFQNNTLNLLTELNFINVVVDQPQTPANSVPLVPYASHTDLTFIRLHGRNYQGWLNDTDKDWRKVRTLYDYSNEELSEIGRMAQQLEKISKEVCIIFNNNSGGHAAPNAKTLQKQLGIDFKGLGPKQLDLF